MFKYLYGCCMKRFACNTATFFGCQPSSSDPICVVIERKRGEEGEGGRETRGRESVHLDFLSSVAVVGQGRPSLGDAHYQFFWRTEHKNRSIKIQVTAQKAYEIKCWQFFLFLFFFNMEATQGLIMWYKYGSLHSCAVTITRCLSLFYL